MSSTLEGLRSIKGQPNAALFLSRAVSTDRLASAYLFEGPEGVGKERTALALAQITVCRSRMPDGDACGACASCKHVASRTHVDVMVLSRTIDVLTQQPEAASNIKSELTVDKVRELQAKRLAYQSHEGERWILVRDAHEMNVSAANAFLKTLEEPPARTHIVLLSSQPSRLLVTIRSRCQRVRFAPLPEDVVREQLLAQGIGAELAAQAAKFADGSMARAAELCDGEALTRSKSWVDKVLGALRSGRPASYVETAVGLKELGKEDDAPVRAVLLMLERHFRDEAIAFAGSQPKRSSVCASRADLVRQTTDSLDRNLNLQLVLESMLLRLREVRS